MEEDKAPVIHLLSVYQFSNIVACQSVGCCQEESPFLFFAYSFFLPDVSSFAWGKKGCCYKILFPLSHPFATEREREHKERMATPPPPPPSNPLFPLITKKKRRRKRDWSRKEERVTLAKGPLPPSLPPYLPSFLHPIYYISSPLFYSG